MSDVGERPAVHHGRCAFCCLHQVGVESIFEQYGDGTFHAHVLDIERSAVVLNAEEDIADATAQVLHTCGKAHDGHDLRGRRDVEARLGDHAVGAGAEAGDDMS